MNLRIPQVRMTTRFPRRAGVKVPCRLLGRHRTCALAPRDQCSLHSPQPWRSQPSKKPGLSWSLRPLTPLFTNLHFPDHLLVHPTQFAPSLSSLSALMTLRCDCLPLSRSWGQDLCLLNSYPERHAWHTAGARQALADSLNKAAASKMCSPFQAGHSVLKPQ